jgi:hypothetical protein
MVPAGAKIVGAVDMTRARNSEFGQYLLTKAQADDIHFQEMINETGFDPRRDLEDILFATSGPTGMAGQEPSFVIFARGNFDVSKIKSLAALKGGMKLMTYGGVDLLVHGQDSSSRNAIGFLDVGVAAIGDLATLKQIIDNRTAAPMLDADLQSKIQSIGNADDAWFVSMVGGASFLGNHVGPQGASQAQALKGVLQSSGGVKLGATIATTFDAVTRSEKDAQSLTDVIRFMASMVQMQRQSNPQAGILANALDGMTLQNSGTAVHLAVSLPEKSLEQLAEIGPRAGVAVH